MEVNAVPAPVPVAGAGPLRVELRLGSGQCHTKGCVEGEQHEPYDAMQKCIWFCTKTFPSFTEVAAYSSFYAPSDYPVTKVLREPVYVEVRILERSDPNIILNLEHCWATSNPAPNSLPQWDLLINGYIKAINYLFTSTVFCTKDGPFVAPRCPYHDDNYLTRVVPVDGSSGLQYPTHHKRFVVKMFTFVHPNDFFPLHDTVQQSSLKLVPFT